MSEGVSEGVSESRRKKGEGLRGGVRGASGMSGVRERVEWPECREWHEGVWSVKCGVELNERE